MTKNFLKFKAFAAAHPKLLGRSSLFGAVNEDHTAFKLFVEYIKQQKFIYHRLPQSIGIAEFKAYILSQDAVAYQEIIDKIDTLHARGNLRDQLGARDLLELANIFDEAGLTEINPRFAESTYNQFLIDSYSYSPVNETTSGDFVTVNGKKDESNSTESATITTDKAVTNAPPRPVVGDSTFYGGVMGAVSEATSVESNLSLNSQSAQKSQSIETPEIGKEQAQLVVPPTSNIPVELPEEVPASQADELPAEANNLPKPKLDEQARSITLPDIGINETKSLEIESESTLEVPVSVAQGGSERVKAPAKFFVPQAAKGGQNIRFLDTVSGLRQRAKNKPNFAQENNATDEDLAQMQQQGYSQNSSLQARQRSEIKKTSPGKKLMSRIFKSIAGLGGALALIPNTSASASVLKKAITVVLFSLIIVTNFSIITQVVEPDSFTAYAANPAAPAAPAPAEGVPAATCPAPWSSVSANSCMLDPFPADAKCPDGFPVESSREGTKLVCTQAAENTTAATEELKKMTGVIVGIQKFLNSVIWPILVMIGGLMDSSFLFGSGMEERLRDIWIPMRNLVNILFVIVLVGVALYNVLGIGEEGGSYSIKSILPKIVVGIIAVNFSFLGIKVVLDATNAITTSIFALPADVNLGLDKIINTETAEGKLMEQKLCANIQGETVEALANKGEGALSLGIAREVATRYFPKQISQATTMAEIDALVSAESAKGDKAIITTDRFKAETEATKNKQMCNGLKLTKTGENYLSQWSSKSAALAMALNMGGIVFYNDVKIDVDTIDKLFINALFSTIMYIVYVASFIALFIILLGRLLVMWICVAMSPLLVLVMFSSELKDKVGGFAKLEEQFTKNAIAPIIIAISMTVGWIMLNALKGLNTISTTGSVSLYDVIPNNGVPVAGLDTLGDFIVALGTIGVVWLGVFGAAEGTVAQGAVDMIGNGLKSAGKFIGTAPLKHLNIVPIKLPGSAENYSLSDVGGAIQQLAEGPTRNKLIENLSGDKGFSAKSFMDRDVVKDKPSFYQALNRAYKDGNKFKDPKFIEELKTFREKRKDIYNSQLPPEIKRKFDAVLDGDYDAAKVNALLDAVDPATGKRIRDAAELDTKVTNPKPSAPGTASAPATPGAKAAVAAMDDADVQKLPIGDTTVGAEIKTNNLDAGANVSALKTAATSVVGQLEEITDPAKATDQEKSALESRFEDLHVGEEGAYPKDQSQLMGLLGANNAKKIMDIYGGQSGYDTMINRVKEKVANDKAAADEKKKEVEGNPDLAASAD